MKEFEFRIISYLGSEGMSPQERETLASFQIDVAGIPVTEVYDTIAQTTRPYVNVSLYAIVQWLLVNWWRLRWEPRPNSVSTDWRRAHAVASIGGGFAWPSLEFASDGEFIQVQSEAEIAPDASGIRYLRSVCLDISAAAFEAAVDHLVDQVDSRLVARVPGEVCISELRAELSQERSDPRLSAMCKLQALAGFDPGAAPEDWLESAANLLQRTGRNAGEEIVAALTNMRDGFRAVEDVVEAMRVSPVTISLSGLAFDATVEAARGELPWQKGARCAARIRRLLQISDGPVDNDALGDILGVGLPLQPVRWGGARSLLGGYRNGQADGRISILVNSSRPDSQRFYLARLIGSALVASPDDHVLPVTDTSTALQKFERSFAQELLCPWAELAAFTEEHGLDEEAIAEAAEFFGVSEWLVISTLVNRNKLPRHRLPLC
jgi:hypothetical protein